ncbi:MAG: hypothetical protein PSN34_12945 [Urechidicola sp.]|nr:hypothetical protein [Urechidicola sp.]
MRKQLIILTFLIGYNSYSQESVFLIEKDTLFIIYDSPKSNKNIAKHYKNNPKRTGVNTIFFLMDNSRVDRRNNYYKTREDNYNNGGGSIGASSTCDWCFGLYFYHSSGNIKLTEQSLFVDPFIINHKKRFEEKINKSLRDSLNFDKFVFNMAYYRYNPPAASLQLSEIELKRKSVFYFDGSTKKYNELKELLKEPHYLFMLDKKWSNSGFNNLQRGEYYIFNEVMYRNSHRLVPD